MRIISLLPSATEIVAELGLLDRLVGRSAECDWPPEVRALPEVSMSRVDSEALTGLEIDRAVREAVSAGLPLYEVDEARIRAVGPAAADPHESFIRKSSTEPVKDWCS